jgi:hypothetical protein
MFRREMIKLCIGKKNWSRTSLFSLKRNRRNLLGRKFVLKERETQGDLLQGISSRMLSITAGALVHHLVCSSIL